MTPPSPFPGHDIDIRNVLGPYWEWTKQRYRNIKGKLGRGLAFSQAKSGPEAAGRLADLLEGALEVVSQPEIAIPATIAAPIPAAAAVVGGTLGGKLARAIVPESAHEEYKRLGEVVGVTLGGGVGAMAVPRPLARFPYRRAEPPTPKVEPSVPKAEPSVPKVESPSPKAEPMAPKAEPEAPKIELEVPKPEPAVPKPEDVVPKAVQAYQESGKAIVDPRSGENLVGREVWVSKQLETKVPKDSPIDAAVAEYVKRPDVVQELQKPGRFVNVSAGEKDVSISVARAFADKDRAIVEAARSGDPSIVNLATQEEIPVNIKVAVFEKGGRRGYELDPMTDTPVVKDPTLQRGDPDIVEVPLKDLYDLGKDPLKLNSEAAIREAGYRGYRIDGVVKLFDPMPARPANPVEKAFIKSGERGAASEDFLDTKWLTRTGVGKIAYEITKGNVGKDLRAAWEKTMIEYEPRLADDPKLLEKLWNDSQKKHLQLMSKEVVKWPTLEYLSDLYRKGKHERFWYEHSAEILGRIAGPYYNLLASLISNYSPNAPNEIALRNALATFLHWITGNIDKIPTDKTLMTYRTKDMIKTAMEIVSNYDPKNPDVVIIPKGPKRTAYALNLMAYNPHRMTYDPFKADRATMDRFMGRMFGIEGSITEDVYPALAEFQRQFAMNAGRDLVEAGDILRTMQAQAGEWAGFPRHTDKSIAKAIAKLRGFKEGQEAYPQDASLGEVFIEWVTEKGGSPDEIKVAQMVVEAAQKTVKNLLEAPQKPEEMTPIIRKLSRERGSIDPELFESLVKVGLGKMAQELAKAPDQTTVRPVWEKAMIEHDQRLANQPEVLEALWKRVQKEYVTETPDRVDKLLASPNLEESVDKIFGYVPQDVKKGLVEQIDRWMKANPERSVVTFEDIKREAAEIDPSIVYELAPPKGTTLHPAVRYAARQMLNSLVKDIARMRKELKDAPPDARMSIESNLEVAEVSAQRILSVLLPTRSQDGRNLVYHRIMTDATWDPEYWVSRARRAMGLPPDMVPPEKVTRRVLEIIQKGDEARSKGDAAAEKEAKIELAKMMKELDKVGFIDTLSLLIRAGYLTSPVSHFANILGNASWMLMNELARIPALPVDLAMSLVTKRRTVGGPNPMAIAKAAKSAAVEGVRKAVDILRGVPDAEAMRKLDSPEMKGINNPIANAYIQMAFRTLGAEDAIFRQMAYVRSLEERMRLTGKDASDKELVAEAILDAEEAVFSNRNLMSEMWHAARARTRSHGPMGGLARLGMDLTVPFVTTPTNIANQVVRMTPPVAMAEVSARVINALAKRHLPPNEQRAIAMTIGRGAVGSAGILLGWKMAEHGMLTSPVPPDPGRRATREAQSRPSTSVRIGDFWWDVGRYAPVGNMLAIGAALYEENERPLRSELQRAPKTIGRAIRTIIDHPMLTGLNDAIEAITEPEVKATTVAARMVSGIVVPVLAGHVAMMMDDQSREVAADKLTDMIVERLMSRVPKVREQLPEKIDVLGMTPPPYRPLPLPHQKGRENDPVVQALVETGVTIGPIPRKVGEPEDEWRMRRSVAGRLTYLTLMATVDAPEYRSANKEQKRIMLENTIDVSRRAASRISAKVVADNVLKELEAAPMEVRKKILADGVKTGRISEYVAKYLLQ